MVDRKLLHPLLHVVSALDTSLESLTPMHLLGLHDTDTPPRFLGVKVVITTLIILALDWLSGPMVVSTVTYVLPVLWAAWFGRRSLALAVTLLLIGSRFLLEIVIWQIEWDVANVINFSLRAVVLLFLALISFRISAHTRQARRQLASIVMAADDAIFSFDLNSTIQTWNPGAEHLFGYTETEIVGQSVWILIPEAHRAAVETNIAELRTGAPLASYQSIRQHRDGHLINVSIAAFPLYDSNGALNGGAAIVRDITEKHRLDAQLRMAELRYRTLVEQVPSTTYITEFDDASLTGGRLDYVSPQILPLLRYPPDTTDIASCLTYQDIHPDDRDWVVVQARQHLHNHARLSIEHRLICQDGETVWVQHTLSPLLSLPGQADFIIGTLTDITDRKRADEQQQQMDVKIQQTQKLESLGVLAGGIAHDFNNILTSILGYNDLALLELSPHHPAFPLIENAMHGSRQAAELINQMLAYSGKGRFAIRPLDLSELTEHITRLLEVSISKKSLLKYHLLPHPPTIEADAAQLRQVIMNLVINASDAIGERSGVISITTGVMHCDRAYLRETYLDENLPEGQYVYLEVTDNGVGMDEATRSRIFEPFFTTKFTGRGLGLAAVLGIVRGHRGALKVYSELHVGTTFKVLFPATDLPSTSAHQRDRPIAQPSHRGLALIIDDEESVRALAGRMLARMGFVVRAAADGRTGVEAFRQAPNEVSVVLLDMTMPHMDGVETFRELRRIRSDVCVILSSGYNEQTAINQFVGKGLAGFIQKPYRFEDLYGLIRRVLNVEETEEG